MYINHLKITVCIVSFNHENYISSCLTSVISQRVDARLEVLVGDDCSTDNTRKIITEYAEKYPALIFPVFHEKNLGASKNYQSLISKASGDFIAHLDGDDFWLPEKLAMQLEFMTQHPECVAVYSNAAVFNNKNTLLGAFNNWQPTIFDINYLLDKGNFLNHSSLFYRAAFKDEILKIGSAFIDYRIHLNLAKCGKLGYLNKTLVIYRFQTPTSMLVNMPKTIQDLYWDAIFDVTTEDAKPKAIESCIKNFYLTLCDIFLRRREFNFVIGWFKKIEHHRGLKFALGCVGLVLINFFVRAFIFPIKKTLKLINPQTMRIFHNR